MDVSYLGYYIASGHIVLMSSFCLCIQVNDVGSLLAGGGLNLCAVDVQDMVIKYKDTWACIEHIRVSTYTKSDLPLGTSPGHFIDTLCDCTGSSITVHSLILL